MRCVLPELRYRSRAQILRTETVIVATAVLRHFVCPFCLILLQSRTFKKVAAEALNDANLIPGIHEAFQGRFERWWELHEISASTMFSVKMTTHRVLRALMGLGSVVIIIAGLLIRQAMGMGGDGLMR